MIYALIFTHWIADFIFQTDDMAKNKSKSNVWLGKHVFVYGGILWAFCLLTVALSGFKLPQDFRYLQFVGINMAGHFVTDYFTSRINSNLWAKGEVHNFFVCVGFDQAIHLCTLIATYNWLLK